MKLGSHRSLVLCIIFFCLGVLHTPLLISADTDFLERGRAIYTESCASCHGEQGGGVEGAYDDPLVGDESVGQLAGRIERTMPEGEPEECVGEQAEAVAAYIHHSFYSEAAQVRNRPPRIGLARLTANQLRQSIADLYEQFEGHPDPNAERGVKGLYFDGDRWKNENKKIERIDPTLNFDFERNGPGEGINPEAFYIYWEGGIRADQTGRYEIVMRSTCSFVLDFGRMGRELIDNHTQSGDKTEFRASVLLTAGRVYPFKIDFVQRKRKTEQPPANISLSWVPPGGVEQIIPHENLMSYAGPPTFSLQTVLPSDDRSYGFERGIAINREWDESTTAAALEFAHIAVDELWPSYLRKHRKDPEDNRTKMREFLRQIVQTAFRQPLDEDMLATYITKQLEAEEDDSEALKRALLISLKSPRFLYPYIDSDQTQSQRVANRLALVLYDSLPTDRELLKAVAKDEFKTPEQVRSYAREHLQDTRLRAKTRDMFREWLNVAQFTEITKDSTNYPGFDDELVYDLKRSLDAFVDEVAWGESGDFRQFFNSKWAFTTQRMADFYGPDWQPTEPLKAGELGRTSESPEHPRFGLLTHPFLMSALGYHDASSPIHRGVFLIRYILGRTLRPPAEAFSPLSPDLHPELTTRQRVDLQTSPESCQVCHHKINGLGFTLENYDAAGRFRAIEKDKPIDASGQYTSRDDISVEFSELKNVADYLTESVDAKRAFVNRAFQFFVKQPAAAFGEDTVDRLTEKFENAGCNIRELIVEIAVIAAAEPTQFADEKVAQIR